MTVAHTQAPKKAPAPQTLRIKGDTDGNIERKRIEDWLADKIISAASEPIVEVVTLTPHLAAILLMRNASNRPVSTVNLDRIKRDIAAGRWEFNGEAIVISKDGLLNDGQHRAKAVLETGIAIRTVIVFGPERNTRFTLDQGAVRSVANYLAMNGHTDTNNLAAAASHAWCYRDLGRLAVNGYERPTKSESLLMVEHYKDLTESLNFISRPNVGTICTRSVLAFGHWAVKRAGGEAAANEFFDYLIGGAGLEERNPILYCRNRLISTKGSHKTNDKAEIIFRAWNAWRRGEHVDRINVMGKKLPALEK